MIQQQLQILECIYPEKLKTYVHTKNLHMDVYRNFIHNCQNLEAAKIPFQRTNYDTFTRQILLSLKETSYQAIKEKTHTTKCFSWSLSKIYEHWAYTIFDTE